MIIIEVVWQPMLGQHGGRNDGRFKTLLLPHASLVLSIRVPRALATSIQAFNNITWRREELFCSNSGRGERGSNKTREEWG